MEFEHAPYIPFLPDDVALECLLRVSPRSHNLLQDVSRKWRSLVASPEFHEHRRKEGATHQYLCLLQAAPQSDPDHHPVYRISVLDTSNAHHTWERLPPIPELGHLGLPTFCRLASTPGKLILLGGWHPVTHTPLTSVHIFSFTSWTWHRGADMPTTRSFFACSSLNAHHIIVAGGHDVAKSALASAELFNVTTNAWRPLPHMTSARDECTGVATLGVAKAGRFLVMGGYNSKGAATASGEVYDVETNAWAMVPSMGRHASAGSAVGTSQGVFAFREREVVRFRDAEAKWEVVGTLPAGEGDVAAVASAAGLGRGLAVTGVSGGDEERCRSFVYRFCDSSKRGVWEALPVDGDFVGATLASCAVEC